MRDPYRYCIHCQADCDPDYGNQGHTMECPALTGIFPVDFEGRCLHCGYLFQPTDYYVRIDDELCCIGCGAREMILDA